ncbi:MAG: hypothetical protein M3N29_03655 [Chloroflexota bacterium]|nr:hypothetical protein [Chloroflexota bacterium]
MNVPLVLITLVSITLFAVVAFLVVRRRQRVDPARFWSALLVAWAGVLVVGFVFARLPFTRTDVGVAMPLIAGVVYIVLWAVMRRLSPVAPRGYLLVLGVVGIGLGVVGVLLRASGLL